MRFAGGALARGLVRSFDARPPSADAGFTAGDIGLILGLWLLTRLGLAAIALMVAGGDAAEIGATLCRFDCPWYVEIAASGYDEEVRRWPNWMGANWAFFPALPLLIAGTSQLTGLAGTWAGIACAQVLALAAYALMFVYVQDFADKPTARAGVVLLALSPFAVHGSVPMSEAVFVPLLIAVFLAARREAWGVVALAAAALSATRTIGVLVAIPLALMAWRQFGLWRLLRLAPGTEMAVLAIAASGLGLAAFMLHLDWVAGDGLGFSHIQVAWNRAFVAPWTTVFAALNPLTAEPGWYIYDGLNLLVTLGALVLVAAAFRVGLGPEAVYVTVAILIALTTGKTTSLPRFIGAMAPLVVPVAIWAQAGGRLAPVAIGSATLAAVVAWLWCAGVGLVM